MVTDYGVMVNGVRKQDLLYMGQQWAQDHVVVYGVCYGWYMMMMVVLYVLASAHSGKCPHTRSLSVFACNPKPRAATGTFYNLHIKSFKDFIYVICNNSSCEKRS